jgi:mRNA interferase RelE/StbE
VPRCSGVNWTLEFARSALKDLRSIDRPTQQRIRTFLEERIATLQDPRSAGNPLKGERCEYWRYRIGNYRVICELQDERIVILVLRIDHRKAIYQ